MTINTQLIIALSVGGGITGLAARESDKTINREL
jgi:hypothetical protein